MTLKLEPQRCNWVQGPPCHNVSAWVCVYGPPAWQLHVCESHYGDASTAGFSLRRYEHAQKMYDDFIALRSASSRCACGGEGKCLDCRIRLAIRDMFFRDERSRPGLPTIGNGRLSAEDRKTLLTSWLVVYDRFIDSDGQAPYPTCLCAKLHQRRLDTPSTGILGCLFDPPMELCPTCAVEATVRQQFGPEGLAHLLAEKKPEVVLSERRAVIRPEPAVDQEEAALGD